MALIVQTSLKAFHYNATPNVCTMLYCMSTSARLGGAGGSSWESGPGSLNTPSRGPAEGWMEFSGSLSLLSRATSFSGLVRGLRGGRPNLLRVTSTIQHMIERERGIHFVRIWLIQTCHSLINTPLKRAVEMKLYSFYKSARSRQNVSRSLPLLAG